MERRLKKKEPQYGWIAIVALVVFVIAIYLLLPYDVFGATYAYRATTQSGYEVDSVVVIRWDNHTDSASYTVWKPVTGDSNRINVSVSVTDSVPARLDPHFFFHAYQGDSKNYQQLGDPVYWNGDLAHLHDSTTFQGAASLTAKEITDSMTSLFGSGPYGSSVGDGSDSVTHYFYDSGNAELVARAHVTVYNAAGNVVTNRFAPTTGKLTVGYTDGSTYTVIVEGPLGYLWSNHSFTASSGLSDTAYGYNFVDALPTPSSDGLASVRGWIKTLAGVGLEGAVVTIRPTYNSKILTDSSSTARVMIAPFEQVAYADSSGFWSSYVYMQEAHSDSSKGYYDFSCSYGGQQIWEIKRVPVTSTTLNLGEIHVARE